jgi:hypothetical protein
MGEKAICQKYLLHPRQGVAGRCCVSPHRRVGLACVAASPLVARRVTRRRSRDDGCSVTACGVQTCPDASRIRVSSPVIVSRLAGSLGTKMHGGVERRASWHSGRC